MPAVSTLRRSRLHLSINLSRHVNRRVLVSRASVQQPILSPLSPTCPRSSHMPGTEPRLKRSPSPMSPNPSESLNIMRRLLKSLPLHHSTNVAGSALATARNMKSNPSPFTRQSPGEQWRPSESVALCRFLVGRAVDCASNARAADLSFWISSNADMVRTLGVSNTKPAPNGTRLCSRELHLPLPSKHSAPAVVTSLLPAFTLGPSLKLPHQSLSPRLPQPSRSLLRSNQL